MGNTTILWIITNTTASKPHGPTGVTAWAICMILVWLVGGVAYPTLFLVMYRLGRMKTGCGALIVYTFVMEWIACTVISPLRSETVYLKYTRPWTPYPFCYYVQLTAVMFFHACHWASFFVSLNRVVALVYPHCYAAWTSRRVLAGLMGSSWIITIVLMLPVTQGIGVQFLESPVGSGVCKETTIDLYGVLWGVLGVYLPLGMNLAICCWLMALMTYRSYAVRRGTAASRSIRRKLKLVRILFVLSVWCGACFAATPVALKLAAGMSQVTSIIMWLRLLQVAGYAFNPVIFMAMNSEYPRELAIICGRHRVRQIQPDSNTLANLGVTSRV